METFFTGDVVKEPFVTFSHTHLATLLVLIISNTLLILWFQKSKNPKMLDRFGTGLGILLLLNEAFYLLWSAASGSWSLEYSLPLQLCDVATLLAGFMLLRSHYPTFEIVYFWGLGGSLQALLTPDLAYPFPHVIFFNFFLGHGAILTAIFFTILVKGYRPTLKSIGRTFVFTNLYMVFVAIINVLTHGNYMFICSKPESASIIDWLGPWPWYIFSLEGVALVIFFLCYLPHGIRDWRRKKLKIENGELRIEN